MCYLSFSIHALYKIQMTQLHAGLYDVEQCWLTLGCYGSSRLERDWSCPL